MPGPPKNALFVVPVSERVGHLWPRGSVLYPCESHLVLRTVLRLVLRSLLSSWPPLLAEEENPYSAVPSNPKVCSQHFSGLEEAVYRNIQACKELAQTTRTAYGPNGNFQIPALRGAAPSCACHSSRRLWEGPVHIGF